MYGEGRAVCLGDDINTDLIIAGRYLRTKDRRVWAEHVFEDLDPGLAARLGGAVLIAGRNFGSGSSREQAVIALREAGVTGIVASGIARIFFRNAINIGLPVMECEVGCSDGAAVRFNLEEGWVETGGRRHTLHPISPRMLDILKAVGLVEVWRRRK